jgi:four helix bundle protein
MVFSGSVLMNRLNKVGTQLCSVSTSVAANISEAARRQWERQLNKNMEIASGSGTVIRHISRVEICKAVRSLWDE